MKKTLLLVLFFCSGVLIQAAYAEETSFPGKLPHENCSKDAKSRVGKLKELISEERGRYGDDIQTVRSVNWFFYKQVWLTEDIRVWRKKDYWTTPAELLCKGRGDSEDFAIAKYFTLKEIGISEERLRLVYADSRLGPVIILVYYLGNQGNEPLLLSHRKVDKLGNRKDLDPKYAFNAYTLWTIRAGWIFTQIGDVRNIRNWQEVIRRMDNAANQH